MADASLPAVQSAEWRNWIATAPQLLGDNSGSRRKYAVACVAYLESVPDPLALDRDPDGLSRERAIALTEIGIDPLDSDDDESGFLVWLTAIAAAGFVAAAAPVDRDRRQRRGSPECTFCPSNLSAQA